jgi:hypothetical protein
MKRALLPPFALGLGFVVACGEGGSFAADPKPDASDSVPDAVAPDSEAPTDGMVPNEPEEGGPMPDRILIAEGQDAPTGIVVDATSVYFANRDAGTIVKCPLSGCGPTGPTELASDQDHPISLAKDATHLYWVIGWREGDRGGGVVSRAIKRCELPGCSDTIEEFDSGGYQAQSVSVVGDLVYIAAWPILVSCSKEGCTSTGTTMLGHGPFISVDKDDAWIFAAKYGQSQVERCPLTGCAGTTVFMSDIQPLSVVIDDSSVYVSDYVIVAWRPDVTGGLRERRVL